MNLEEARDLLSSKSQESEVKEAIQVLLDATAHMKPVYHRVWLNRREMSFAIDFAINPDGNIHFVDPLPDLSIGEFRQIAHRVLLLYGGRQ